MCIIQCLSVAPRQPCQDQRHSIFRTRCTIKYKVCNSIIDGGGSKNIVLGALVRALGLKTERHPSPYKVGWICKGIATEVDDICQVQSNIGKFYQDEVLCDVVDMDACYILFDRSWQFDVNATHKGHENSSSFEWKDKKITLVPPANPDNAATIPTLLTVPRPQFEKDVTEATIVIALLAKDPDSTASVLPPAVQLLLDEFWSLTPTELPNELPPMKVIQHRIDLVPGSTLSNLPHYRLNLKEQDILRE